MIAEYLEEVCRSLDISDGSGNLEARACCADELCVVLLILGILRNMEKRAFSSVIRRATVRTSETKSA